MKNYKEFEKINLGYSDVAGLIFRAPCKVTEIHTGADGDYSAYECFGEVSIGEHYTLEFDGEAWLKVYDDAGLTYYKSHIETGFNKFSIYNAGKTFIIHWHE